MATSTSSKARKRANPVSRSYTTTKGDKVTVLKNGTKIVNGQESGKVPVKEGYRQVQGQSGSSRIVKIGSGQDKKYDSTGYYTKANYANPFTKTIQSTTGQRTKDLRTQTRFNEVMQSRNTGVPTPTLPNASGGTPTPVTTPNNQSSRIGTGATPTPDINNPAPTPAASIVSSTQNDDGTYTNMMSDGSTKIESGIQYAERQYNEQANKQLSALDEQKRIFDTKIDRLLKSNNALYNSTISSIKSTFDVRRDQLGQSFDRLKQTREKAGYQTDSFRYTPTHAEGLVTNDENNYINDLADLDAQEEGLILQAIQAKEAKDWEALDAQMKMYDTLNQQKTTLYAQLLTAAQTQNRRIEEEARIERELAEKAAATPISAGAAALAANVAPVLAKEIDKLTQDEAVAFLEKKAKELNVDVNILRSAVIDRRREDADYARSLQPKPKTEKVTKEDHYSTINELISGDYSVDGTPYTDPNGFFTPEGFRTIQLAALASGISRSEFLENYGGNLNPDTVDQYGLTNKEKEDLGY